jgi:hypothetical protein
MRSRLTPAGPTTARMASSASYRGRAPASESASTSSIHSPPNTLSRNDLDSDEPDVKRMNEGCSAAESPFNRRIAGVHLPNIGHEPHPLKASRYDTLQHRGSQPQFGAVESRLWTVPRSCARPRERTAAGCGIGRHDWECVGPLSWFEEGRSCFSNSAFRLTPIAANAAAPPLARSITQSASVLVAPS